MCLCVDGLNAMPGVYCPNPGGAFYAIAKLPIDDSDKFCQWLLEEFAFNNQTVMLAPATGFYGTEGLGKNEVRLAYVLNLDALAAAMDCLEEALTVYPGRVSLEKKTADVVKNQEGYEYRKKIIVGLLTNEKQTGHQDRTNI